METWVVSLVTVFAWGTWLAPSQAVEIDQRVKVLYVTLANLLLAVAFAGGQGFAGLDAGMFALPLVGGIIWALSGRFAFSATDHIGIARAMGIWAPLNVVVSIVWGMILFGEFLEAGTAAVLLAALAVGLIVAGIVLIVRSGDPGSVEVEIARRDLRIGLTGALAAGVLWGSYFIPIRVAEVSLWVAALPMAVGMVLGSLAMCLAARLSPRLPAGRGYVRLIATGLLWGVGNYGSLKLMALIGTGRGFTIAQLCVAVNALVGIWILRRPAPGTRAARWTLIGVALALVGGILLGNLKV